MRTTLLAALLSVACACAKPAPPAATPPAATPPAAAAAPAPAPGAKGTVEKQSFQSAALGVEKEYWTYLPAGYADSGDRKYPLIVMLHGLGGDETNWLKLGNLAEAADAMGLQAIVVMPDGDASFYADAVTGVPYDTCMNGQHFLRSHPKERTCVKGSAYETYIVKDLLAEIGARYRVIDDRKARAIGGLSMGGYGALMLGMRHKNVFSSVASHSGVDALLYVGPHPYEKGKVVLLDDVKLWGSNIEPLGGWVRLIFGPDVANWRAHDPAHLARSLKNGELAIYLDCGTEDDFSLHNGAQYLDEVLTSAGVAHDFTLLPGRHNFTFWKERIDDSLAFHARQFEAAGY